LFLAADATNQRVMHDMQTCRICNNNDVAVLQLTVAMVLAVGTEFADG